MTVAIKMALGGISYRDPLRPIVSRPLKSNQIFWDALEQKSLEPIFSAIVYCKSEKVPKCQCCDGLSKEGSSHQN